MEWVGSLGLLGLWGFGGDNGKQRKVPEEYLLPFLCRGLLVKTE